MAQRLVPHRRRSWSDKLQSSRMALGLGIVVLLFFAVSLGREVVRQVEARQEFQQLQKEIDTLASRNVELSDLIDVLDTESFREREARTKLGLQRAGEQVVIISHDGEPALTNATTAAQPVAETTSSNVEKWWRYFFHE